MTKMKSKCEGFSAEKYLVREMVFITGLNKRQQDEHWIKSQEGFGQFGQILSVFKRPD